MPLLNGWPHLVVVMVLKDNVYGDTKSMAVHTCNVS
jgi:hypothetical protein